MKSLNWTKWYDLNCKSLVFVRRTTQSLTTKFLFYKGMTSTSIEITLKTIWYMLFCTCDKLVWLFCDARAAKCRSRSLWNALISTYLLCCLQSSLCHFIRQCCIYVLSKNNCVRVLMHTRRLFVLHSGDFAFFNQRRSTVWRRTMLLTTRHLSHSISFICSRTIVDCARCLCRCARCQISSIEARENSFRGLPYGSIFDISFVVAEIFNMIVIVLSALVYKVSPQRVFEY